MGVTEFLTAGIAGATMQRAKATAWQNLADLSVLGTSYASTNTVFDLKNLFSTTDLAQPPMIEVVFTQTATVTSYASAYVFLKNDGVEGLVSTSTWKTNVFNTDTVGQAGATKQRRVLLTLLNVIPDPNGTDGHQDLGVYLFAASGLAGGTALIAAAKSRLIYYPL